MWRRGPGPGSPHQWLSYLLKAHLSSAARGGGPRGTNVSLSRGAARSPASAGPAAWRWRAQTACGAWGPAASPAMLRSGHPFQGLPQVLGEPASRPRTQARWGSNAGPAEELKVKSVLWLQMRKQSQQGPGHCHCTPRPPGSGKCLPSCWGEPQPACPHQAPSPLGPNFSFFPGEKSHHHITHVCSPPFLIPQIQ